MSKAVNRFIGVEVSMKGTKERTSNINKRKAQYFIFTYIVLILISLLSVSLNFQETQLSLISIGGPLLIVIIGMRLITVLGGGDWQNRKIKVGSHREIKKMTRFLLIRHMITYIIFILLFVLVMYFIPLFILDQPLEFPSFGRLISLFGMILLGFLYLWFVTQRSVELVNEGETDA